MIDRRTFIGGFAGGLLTWPLAAAAQQPGKVPVVGVLIPVVGPRAGTVDTVRQGLRDLGFIAMPPNLALNRTGRYTASLLLASPRPAGSLDTLGVTRCRSVQ